jgi:hypothetical protein
MTQPKTILHITVVFPGLALSHGWLNLFTTASVTSVAALEKTILHRIQGCTLCSTIPTIKDNQRGGCSYAQCCSATVTPMIFKAISLLDFAFELFLLPVAPPRWVAKIRRNSHEWATHRTHKIDVKLTGDRPAVSGAQWVRRRHVLFLGLRACPERRESQ